MVPPSTERGMRGRGAAQHPHARHQRGDSRNPRVLGTRSGVWLGSDLTSEPSTHTSNRTNCCCGTGDELQLKRFSNQVIVITGASSVIVLTTADMARVQARASSSLPAMKRPSRGVTRIRANGDVAFHIVADVADPDAVDKIADLAIEQFGGIDTW